MRKSTRLVLTVFASLFTVMSAVAWPMSKYATHYVGYTHLNPAGDRFSRSQLETHEGSLRYYYVARPAPCPAKPQSHWSWGRGESDLRATGASFAGFEFASQQVQRTPTQATFVIVSIPFWFMMLGFASAAALGLWSIRNARLHHNPAACANCGYDLRGGHDKCPECGKTSHVPAATPAQA